MLHGERSQWEREDAVRCFRSGKHPLLVATDVAARGLDVRNLPYVVNYDFPSSLDTYIHRCGAPWCRGAGVPGAGGPGPSLGWAGGRGGARWAGQEGRGRRGCWA